LIENLCSKNFTYKDIIQCGETLIKYKDIININPIETDTYEAIKLLCINLLDPIVDNFGNLTLTYGFASRDLTKLIKGRISPTKDQHAGYEKMKSGRYICSRLGQAVDFYIEKFDSNELVNWVIQKKLPFDRMYFYGSNKPIHLSYGPDNKKQLVHMIKLKNGRLMPKVIKND